MTLITTPFGFASTAAEVLDGVDLGGRRAIVTGAASGIGVETARALAGAGAEVTIVARDDAAAARVAADITATTGNPTVRTAHVDLVDRASIDAFTAGWSGPLDILVNNAAVMAAPYERTTDGWELHIATNHLGHVQLTLGLYDALAASGSARVVAVSSTAHLMSPVDVEDLHFEHRPYDPWMGYAQSKSANVLFAVAIEKRWARDGITANALNPGAIATNLQRHIGGMPRMPANRQKSIEQGAATSALVAASPLLDGVTGGRYFHDCNEAPVVTEGPVVGPAVAYWAVDPDTSDRLWDLSVRMTAV